MIPQRVLVRRRKDADGYANNQDEKLRADGHQDGVTEKMGDDLDVLLAVIGERRAKVAARPARYPLEILHMQGLIEAVTFLQALNLVLRDGFAL